MDPLVRLEVVASDDVAAVRQLTRDMAREAGLAALDQTKLATAASELARRSLAAAGRSEVTFGLDAGGQGARLIVAVTGTGPEPGGGPGPAARSGRQADAGLDLHTIRGLVDDFELTTGADGSTGVEVAARLAPGHAAGADLARRLAGVRPRVSPAMLERRNLELSDALALVEAQSWQLEAANDELTRANEERAAVNAELAITNRGVLDLNAELERRAEELAAANASLATAAESHRQLAEQQTALAALGRSAMAARDTPTLAGEVVGTVRQVLGVDSCAVLRFEPAEPRLHVVAADGCDLGPPGPIEIRADLARRLREGGAVVADPTAGPDEFPLPAPPGRRSAAAIPVRAPGEPWGLLVACEAEPDRFTESAVAFVEAAAALLASSIARTSTEDAATHAALHDSLTGLPNRAKLLVSLSVSCDRRAPASPSQSALIFLDLDGFKAVNDTMGHAAGDAVLVETAARLSALTRPTDVLARLGGDEFVLLCQVADEDAATAVAGRLLTAFDQPFVVDGREVFLAGSAGIALAPHGAAAEQVLADADIAMYRAKQASGSASVVFRADMRDRAESVGRLHNELRRAGERGELRAVYQPIVDLEDGRLHGVEALVRWRHPDLGDVPAERTVAAAEQIGMAWELTCLVAVEAAAAVGAWNAAHPAHTPLRLAVNFTPLLLDDPARVAEFEAHVGAAGLAFDLLDIELTETAFADPTPTILASIAEIRARGARLAIDDFGTGYSSLVALANLPFDILKVDRSFVAPLDSGADTVLVSAMTGIAHVRSLVTIGEGIETEAQLSALIGAECDLGQGYLFAKPLERDALAGLAAMEEEFAATVRGARVAALGVDGYGQPSPPASPLGRPARVLVVDDNPDDLHLLRVLLGTAGHQITTVSDPADFVRALRDAQPDLVLMDLRMRGVTGFDLVEQAGSLLTVPVVAVTGYPHWVVDRDVRSRRFSEVIAKPLEPADTLARLSAVLARSVPGPDTPPV